MEELRPVPHQPDPQEPGTAAGSEEPPPWRRWLRWLAVSVAAAAILAAAGLGVWWWSTRVTPPREAAPGQVVGLDRAGEAVGRLTGVTSEGDALGQGTAFFVGPEVVVTAWHVIHLMSGGSARVEMADGRVFEVTRVLGVDERVDLAVLRVSPANEGAVLAVAPAAGPEEPEEPLAAVTTPLLFERTTAEGMGRVLHGTPFYGRLLILEAATSPGWSGSPVLDPRGRVRGVVAMGGLAVTMGAPGDLIEELRQEPGTPLKRATGIPRTVEGLVVLKHRLAEMMREEEPGEAIRTLRQMLTYMPDHWPTRELLGELLIERGAHEAGLKQLEQAAWLSPYPRWQFQRLAEEYEKAGKPVEAAAARAKAGEQRTLNPPAGRD